jgi:hypothetical protein
MKSRCNYKMWAVAIIAAIFLCLPMKALAQPGDPDPPGDPVPLTGIELLLAAGGALGGYSIFRKSRTRKD